MTERKQWKPYQRPKEKPIKKGTIVEIPVDEGFAYVQYIYKSTVYGQCIRVFKGIFQERPDDLIARANQTEQLIVFHPITHSIACELCEVVGWAPIPKSFQELLLFKVFSRPIPNSPPPYHWKLRNEKTGESWRVGGETDDYKKIREILPEEYHHFPTWHLVPYIVLLDLIELGWTNESEFFEDFWEARERLPRVQGYLKAAAEEKAAKSRKMKTAESKCPDPPRPNPIVEPLKKLLTRMDGIMEKHDELCDTLIRDQLHDAVFDAFILPQADYVLPEEFSMNTKAGDKRVRSALAAFIKKATTLATKAKLEPGLSRLAAFQDIEVTSENGCTYDEYFGDRPSL